MRPTGLGSGIDKDRPDYAVYCGGWNVGRIYQTRGGPDSLRWFWSMTRQRSDDALGWPLPVSNSAFMGAGFLNEPHKPILACFGVFVSFRHGCSPVTLGAKN